MPPVLKGRLGIEAQSSPVKDQVEDQPGVLDHAGVHVEPSPRQRIGPPEERGEIRPHPVHETHREVLAAKHDRGVRSGSEHALQPIRQRHDRCALGIDDVDLGLVERDRLSDITKTRPSPADVAVEHSVVTTHEHHVVGRDVVQAPVEVARDTEVAIVGKVVDPRVTQRPQPAGSLWPHRIVVVHDQQPPLGVGLVPDAEDRFLEHVEGTKERDRDVDTGHAPCHSHENPSGPTSASVSFVITAIVFVKAEVSRSRRSRLGSPTSTGSARSTRSPDRSTSS